MVCLQPLARELVRTSRQQLVSHLDGYCRKHNAVFKQVSDFAAPCAF